MINKLKCGIVLKLAGFSFAPLALVTLCSCSSPKPTTPPVVTRVSPGEPSKDSGFGAEVIVNSTVAKATVVSVDSQARRVTLKRADGRLADCKARPGVTTFGEIKVGDEVTIAIGAERALALGTTPLPDNSPNSERLQVRMPEGTLALAEALQTEAFTAKIAAIDPWDRIVTLRLADGTTRAIQTTVAVNLANFNRGDQASVRITEVLVLVVQNAPAK